MFAPAHQSPYPTEFTVVRFDTERTNPHQYFPLFGCVTLYPDVTTPTGLPLLNITLARDVSPSQSKTLTAKCTPSIGLDPPQTFPTVDDAVNHQIITQIINERLIQYMKEGKLHISTSANLLVAPLSSGDRDSMHQAMTRKMYDEHHMYSSDINSINKTGSMDPQLEFEVITKFVNINGPCKCDYYITNPTDKVIEFAICDKFQYNGLLLNVVAKYDHNHIHIHNKMTFEIIAIDHTHQACTVTDVCHVAYPLKPIAEAQTAIWVDIRTRVQRVLLQRINETTIYGSPLFEVALKEDRVSLSNL